MREEQADVHNDHIFFIEKQAITVHNFDASKFILDIGGGGEGVIGQLKGSQVVAIDPNREELEEAAAGPLQIVMDARNLQFLDDAFEVVTSFFTLMYINGCDHKVVFEEVYRVLEPGGRFMIWEVDLPQRLAEGQDVVAFYLTVSLPDREIKTGYGTRWPEQTQGASYYRDLAEHVGFIATAQQENGRMFSLELQKP